MPENLEHQPQKDDNLSRASSSDEEGWQDIEPDYEDGIPVKSLFDGQTFTDARAMLAYDIKNHHFDFLSTCRRLGLDFHGAVKLVNYVRGLTQDGKSLGSEIAISDLDNENLLRPALENDGFIMLLDEVLDEGISAQTPHDTNVDTIDVLKKNVELRRQLEILTEKFSQFRQTVAETLDKRWSDDDTTKEAKLEKETVNPTTGIPVSIDNSYFESYADYDIHETMLKDTVRTDAYRNFVYNNKQIFKDKIVLDIGCGTGILSMFCAKAGAKKVIAVDNSAIIDKARENILKNSLHNIITCVAGRIEEVTLPVPKVDVIISEWMGYALLYEAMLQSVLWARDKYLAPGGLLVPSVSTLIIAPVSDAEYMNEFVDFWDDVYGFDMSVMKKQAMQETRVEHMRPYSLAGTPTMFRRLELHDTTEADLVFESTYKSVIEKDTDNLHGFLVWFDIFFTSRSETVPDDKLEPTKWHDETSGKIAFTTGPLGKETHWKQSLMLIDPENPQPVLKFGQKINGKIVWAIPKEDPRSIVVEVTWKIDQGKEHKQSWNLR